MKPNVFVVNAIANDDYDDLPELLDVSESSEDETSCEEEYSWDSSDDGVGDNTRPRRVRTSGKKREQDGQSVWREGITYYTGRAYCILPSLESRHFTYWRPVAIFYATNPRRNQFIANQFFKRGSRRTPMQIAKDLEKRRKWYQGTAHGNK
ncbi:hypothetical protein AURDEDRAFT_167330 [Auricularia subglabra TFB-10046 SS5]|nr:hypothetical protein AURDEDRAFT_167330 [Auricularia subglabra TFB-10046 SS5]